MRQRLGSPRETSRSSVPHVGLLGEARRTRDLYVNTGSVQNPSTPILGEGRIACRSLANRFDRSVWHARLSEYRADEASSNLSYLNGPVPPLVHRYAVADASLEVDCSQDRLVGSHLPKPASLVAADEGTAKVLAALTADVAYANASQERADESSVLGPRLGLSLDTGEPLTDCIDVSAEEPAVAQGEIGRTLSDFVVEDFSTPEQLDTAGTELNEPWMQEVSGSVAWPEEPDLVVASALPIDIKQAQVTLAEPATTEAFVAEPVPPSTEGVSSSPVAEPVVEEAAASVQEDSPKPVVEKILQGLSRPDRTMPLSALRGSTEEDRMRRAELIRKAMSERMASAAAEGVGKSGLSPRLSRLTWKPGDPYAGWSRRYRFRWHAMALTACSIVGVGYLALRVLVLVGLI